MPRTEPNRFLLIRNALTASCLLAVAGCEAHEPRAPGDFTAERADWVAAFCGLDEDRVRDPVSRTHPSAQPDTVLRLGRGRIGALAAGPGGLIGIYDDANARVIGLDGADGSTEFGRPGSGPGEFVERPVGVEPDHLSVTEHSFLAFDGLRMLEFDLTGRPLHSVPTAALGIARIHLVGLRATSGAHHVGVMEWSFTAPERRLQIYRWTDGQLEPVGGVQLAPLARLPTGAWTWRRFIPMPLWEVAGRCAILSDGSSSELVVLHLETGERRALRVHGHPLADRDLLRLQADEQQEVLDFTRERQLPFSEVEITDPRRWSGLRYDQNGGLWLLPWLQPQGTPIALRIPLTPSNPDPYLIEVTGVPAAFMPDGAPIFLGSSTSGDWADLVLRLAPSS